MQMPFPTHMFDMWVWLVIFAAILILGAVVAVLLLTRPGQRKSSTALSTSPAPLPPVVKDPGAEALTEEVEAAPNRIGQLKKAVELVRPTLTDDERRILNEIVKAGGEILQSDLPEKSDFSKATVSKLIKSLETMGVVTREKHKWTYWVRLSDKLISRAKNA